MYVGRYIVYIENRLRSAHVLLYKRNNVYSVKRTTERINLHSIDLKIPSRIFESKNMADISTSLYRSIYSYLYYYTIRMEHVLKYKTVKLRMMY